MLCKSINGGPARSFIRVFLFFCCCLNAYKSHWCYILCTMNRAHWNKLNSKHSVAQHLFVCWYTKWMEIYKHSSFSSFQNMSLQMPFLSSNNHHHYYLLLRLHFNHHYHRHGYLQHIKFVHKGHSSFLFVFDLLTDYSNKFKRSFVHHFVQVDWIFTMKRNLKNPLSIGWFILIAIVYIISSNSWVTQTYFQCATFYFTTTKTLTRQFSWNKNFMKKIRVLSR